MAGQKRAKEIARAKYERQQSRRLNQKRSRRRNALIAGGVFALIVAIAVGFSLLPESSAEPEPEPVSSASRPPAPVSAPVGVSCSPETAGTATAQYSSAKPMKLQPGSALSLDTNCGPVTIGLAVQEAPKSTNALAFLASTGWYNNGNCHRLTVERIYVVQCGAGDPTGQGDPGFTVPDENLPATSTQLVGDYPRGTVAMANRGPGTSSSQFFIVYKDTQLPPNYSIVGQVTTGLEAIEYVAAQGVSDSSPNLGDGPPAQPLVIKTATVRNGP